MRERACPVQAFVVLSAIMLTPLTWLKDMDSIAFISFTGLVASIASIIFVAVEGLTYTGTCGTAEHDCFCACPEPAASWSMLAICTNAEAYTKAADNAPQGCQLYHC